MVSPKEQDHLQFNNQKAKVVEGKDWEQECICYNKVPGKRDFRVEQFVLAPHLRRDITPPDGKGIAAGKRGG